MPNGAIARPGVQQSESASHLGLGQIDTAGFLFGGETDKNNAKNAQANNPMKTYLQMTDADDFPVLVRRESFPGVLMIVLRLSLMYPTTNLS